MPLIIRLDDATAKLDRLMECVLDTTSAEDAEGSPTTPATSQQPTYEWRPPTRDVGGLERRLARMEENVASIFDTVKTMVDLLHNERVGNINFGFQYSYRQRSDRHWFMSEVRIKA